MDRRLADAERRLNERDRQATLQAGEAQIEGFKRAVTARLTELNVNPADLNGFVEQAADAFRGRQANSLKAEETAAQLQAARQREAVSVKMFGAGEMNRWIGSLQTKLGLDAEDVQLLAEYYNPDAVPVWTEDGQLHPDFIAAGNRIAKVATRLGEGKKAKADLTKTRKATIPANGATSAESGAEPTDAEYIKGYGEGRYNDTAKAEAAMARLGY
jgi:hypothetical protein